MASFEKNHKKIYMQESSWGPLMALVGDGVNGEGRAWAKEKAGIKERWREINTALTELRDAQCTWTIPDPALKANMKDAVAEDFLPLYKVCSGISVCFCLCVCNLSRRSVSAGCTFNSACVPERRFLP